MDDPDVSSRMVLVGHLLITIPAIAVIPLIVYFALYVFGPDLLVYYTCAGLAVSWQWYSIAVPRWKESLRKKDVEEKQIEEIQRRTGVTIPHIFDVEGEAGFRVRESGVIQEGAEGL